MQQPKRAWVGLFLRGLPYLVPAGILAVLLAQIFVIAIGEKPGNDESELLHASYLIANGATPWKDFFENHSPLYLWINAWVPDPNAVLYALYAQLFHLLVYLLSAYLFARACYLWLGIERALWPSFLLLSLIVYLSMTWPAEFGLVRPEGLAFMALFAGAVLGHEAKAARHRFLILFFPVHVWPRVCRSRRVSCPCALL